MNRTRIKSVPRWTTAHEAGSHLLCCHLNTERGPQNHGRCQHRDRGARADTGVRREGPACPMGGATGKVTNHPLGIMATQRRKLVMIGRFQGQEALKRKGEPPSLPLRTVSPCPLSVDHHHSSLPVVGLPVPTPCSRWGPCPGKAPPPRELCHLESGWRLPSVAGLAFSAKGGVQCRLHLRVRSRQLGKRGKATKRKKTRMAQRAGRDLWLCLSPEPLEAIAGLLIGLISILLCLEDQGGQGRDWGGQ